MARVKRKCALEHAQDAQIQVILRIRTYHPGLYSSFIHSVVFIDSVSGQWRPWSDCASAQSDLGLRCPHTPKDTFRMARRIRWGNLVVHMCCVVRACTISKSLFESAVILIKISGDHILIEVFFFYLSEKVRLSVSRLKRNCKPCFLCIMKTCLFKYIANSTTKNWKFSDKKFWYFSYFCSKHNEF